MFHRLLLIFTLVPLVELYILIRAGKFLGLMNTIALVIITGIVGAAFARQQGLGILSGIRGSIYQGRIPGIEMLQGLMVLVGGVLLITPGFITDLVGFTLLIPFTRQFYTKIALNYIKKKFQSPNFKYSTFDAQSKPSDETKNNHQIPE